MSMSKPVRKVGRRPLRWLVLAAAAGCVGPDAEGRVDRHLSFPVWTGAIERQFERPEQYVPEAFLLAGTLALIPQDHKLQRDLAEDQSITEGSTANGDAVGAGLGVLAAGWAAKEWASGDDAQSMEVLIESVLIDEAIVGVLKTTVQRERPLHDSKSSFPSGHTSFSFTVATYLARSIDDSTDHWYGKLGYLAWLPAAYVGIDRVEANRHFPTDVAFGAFLGVTLTNVIYDAHYGDENRRGIFAPERSGFRLEPELSPDKFGFSLAYRF
jgi:PAP2 superfamily